MFTYVSLHILPYVVSLLGLAGTCLVFYFGIPRKIDTAGKIGICLEQEDEAEKNKIKKYKTWGNVGLILIGLSFLLQMINQILLDSSTYNPFPAKNEGAFKLRLS